MANKYATDTIANLDKLIILNQWAIRVFEKYPFLEISRTSTILGLNEGNKNSIESDTASFSLCLSVWAMKAYGPLTHYKWASTHLYRQPQSSWNFVC